MKDQKKEKEQVVENIFGIELTTNEALKKYLGPEHESPKLKEVRKKFSKGVIVHR